MTVVRRLYHNNTFTDYFMRRRKTHNRMTRIWPVRLVTHADAAPVFKLFCLVISLFPPSPILMTPWWWMWWHEVYMDYVCPPFPNSYMIKGALFPKSWYILQTFEEIHIWKFVHLFYCHKYQQFIFPSNLFMVTLHFCFWVEERRGDPKSVTKPHFGYMTQL